MEKTNNEDIAKKGKEGEDALNSWLKEQQLPYVNISQSPDTFADLFSNSVKRPDFLLLIQSMGLIAIDAKNYKLSGGTFTLNLERELLKMITFERLFRIPIWFAYMQEGGKCWYWISGLKVIEVGKIREQKESGEKFLAIRKEDCAEVRTAEDLGKLYTQKIHSAENIKNMIH